MTLISTKALDKLGINSTKGKELFENNIYSNKRDGNLENIERYNGRAIRGILAPKDFINEREILYFQFNPESLSDSKGSNWFSETLLGFSSPQPLWVSGGDRNISFELFFDGTAESNTVSSGKSQEGYDSIRTLGDVYPNGVMDQIEKLQSFQYPINEETPRFVGNVATPAPRFSAPPMLIFAFGPLYMECALTSLSVDYELFDKDLIPRRARCSVNLTVYEFERVIINSNLPKVTSESKAYY